MKKIIFRILAIFLVVILILILALFIALYNGFSGFHTNKNPFDSPEINYYHGIIVNEDSKAIQDVNIETTDSLKISCKSNKQGYFELKKSNLDVIIPNTLILKKNGFITDTIETHIYYDFRGNISDRYFFCKKN
jgi:anionic cell wall polymer biosynthesis LytR-Cps2A-Psr (LCP) family protein